MDVRKIIVIGLAVVAGGVAFMLAMGRQPEVVAPVVQKVEEKTIRVLVADLDMLRGERISADSVRWVEWPEKALSDLYLTEEIIEIADLVGAVARTQIVTGEPIIEGKIVRAGSSGMMAAILQPGMRAVTARVSAETASGGFILPGDRVDLYYTEPSSGSDETLFRILLEDVKVLALDAFYDESSSTPHISGATATLELSPQDAEYFTTARNSRGQITLVLRSIFEPESDVKDKARPNGVQVWRFGRS